MEATISERDGNELSCRYHPCTSSEIETMTTMTKKNAMSVVCLMALCQCAAAFTSSLASYTKSNFGSELKSTSYDWMDFLKFEGQQPSFDVVEKTKQYTAEFGYKQFSLKDIPTDYYDDRYVFRGPIVGPINRKDLVQTNSRFNLQQGFPDLKSRALWLLC